MEVKEIRHELMTVREVAEELGVSLSTAYELVHSGKFRVYRPSRKSIGVFKEDVLAHKSKCFFNGEIQQENVA